MKRLAIIGTFAILAATPASIGLIGNASFSQSVPVRVPADATLLDDSGHTVKAGDDHGRHAEPGDDHGGRGSNDDSGSDDHGSGGHGEDDGPNHS